MPARQTATPSRITRPETVPTTLVMNTPSKMGGISVPKAAQYPSTIAIPSDIPRYRMVRPNVRPPNPHSTPQK